MFDKFIIACDGWFDEGYNLLRNLNDDSDRQDELYYR